MITTNDFKNGITIKYEGTLYEVLYFQHVKPGKGGAFVRTKIRNIDSGAIIEKTFRAGEKIEQAILQTKKMQYLYRDQYYNFMDMKTYDQVPLSTSQIKDKDKFLIENIEVDITFYNGKPISIELPVAIEAKVAKTEPGVKGDTVSNTFKPAEIETGATVHVPLFINEGDIIKIDTRTEQYITRVSK